MGKSGTLAMDPFPQSAFVVSAYDITLESLVRFLNVRRKLAFPVAMGANGVVEIHGDLRLVGLVVNQLVGLAIKRDDFRDFSRLGRRQKLDVNVDTVMVHDTAVPAKPTTIHVREGDFLGKIIRLCEGEDRALLSKFRDGANAAQRPVSKVDMSKVRSGLANLYAGRPRGTHWKIPLVQDNLKPIPQWQEMLKCR